MRIDFGLVLAIIIEYILFIYYADTLFYRKHNRYLCYGIIAVGYIVHCLTCMAGNVALNTIICIAMHMSAFLLCYHIKFKTALFHTALLIVMVMADEFLVIALPLWGISVDPSQFSPQQSFVLTVISRFIYIIEIMYLTRFFGREKKTYESFSVMLAIIPITSVVIFWLLIPTEIEQTWAICTLTVIINIIIFHLDQKLFRKELETAVLKEQIAKESVNYEEYALLSEKYEKTRILRHDIKELLGVLDSLIDDNPQRAKEYIKEMYKKQEDVQFSCFSDNKILNILLSQKKAECNKKGIDIFIDPIQAELSFIKDMDVVTLFSNLLNNGMESCEYSEDKKIFINISTINENYIVIKMINSCDKKPVVINSKLYTIKENSNMHGVGMSSIRRAIKNYNGDLTWSYNENEKLFNTTIIIEKPTVGAKK